MTAHSYPLAIDRGHLVARVDGRSLVVDTGSPCSFGEGGELAFAGRAIEFPVSVLGLDAAQVGSLSGLRIDGILGMDALAHFDLVFAAGIAGNLEVHPRALARPRVSAEVTALHGLPVVTVSDGRSGCACVLDSGAQFTYLPRRYGSPVAVGQANDFHPLLGRYRVALHRPLGELRLGSMALPLHDYAVAPRALAEELLAHGIEGILGVPVFARERLALSMRGRWLGLNGLARDRFRVTDEAVGNSGGGRGVVFH